jgi:glycosyltransferase involved in cell wall biosynthesis
VSFLGRVTDVRTVYAAADVVVAPSRWEGLSFAVLEALACGRAVVATDVEGMREAIGPPPAAGGVLVPPGDVDALTGALIDLLGDPSAARDAGRRARMRAGGFDLPRSTAAVAELTSDVAR